MTQNIWFSHLLCTMESLLKTGGACCNCISPANALSVVVFNHTWCVWMHCHGGEWLVSPCSGDQSETGCWHSVAWHCSAHWHITGQHHWPWLVHGMQSRTQSEREQAVLIMSHHHMCVSSVCVWLSIIVKQFYILSWGLRCLMSVSKSHTFPKTMHTHLTCLTYSQAPCLQITSQAQCLQTKTIPATRT